MASLAPGGRSLEEDWLDDAINAGHVRYIDYAHIENVKYNVAKGGYGTIHAGKWRLMDVAIKELNNPLELVREVKTHKKVQDSSYIIRFYGITRLPWSGSKCMVLQFAQNGSLRDYLNTKFHQLGWRDKMKLALEIASGLSFIHAENIYHHDLHCRNILIDSKGTALITDFGLSRSRDHSVTKSGLFGVVPYVSPERLQHKSYDSRSDIYSLGVVMWEISSGQVPFAGELENILLAMDIVNGKREVTVDGTPREYEALFQQCWDGTPDNRPTIRNILDTLTKMLDIYKEQVVVPLPTSPTSPSLDRPPFDSFSRITPAFKPTPPTSANLSSNIGYDSGYPDSRDLPNLIQKTKASTISSNSSDLRIPSSESDIFISGPVSNDRQPIQSTYITRSQTYPYPDRQTPLDSLHYNVENLSLQEDQLAATRQVTPTRQPVIQTTSSPIPAVNAVKQKKPWTPPANGISRIIDFFKAARDGNLIAVRWHLEHGGNANEPCKEWYDRTPLHGAACADQPFPVIKLLVDNGADVNAIDQDSWTALHFLAAFCQEPLETVRYLLDRGAKVNAKDDTGHTPLMHAFRLFDNPLLVELLLDYGADPSMLSPTDNLNALGNAAFKLRPQCVKYLLENDLSINTPESVQKALNRCRAHDQPAGKEVVKYLKAWLGQSGNLNRRELARRVLDGHYRERSLRRIDHVALARKVMDNHPVATYI